MLGLRAYLPTHQRMVSVTVSPVLAARTEDTVKKGSSSDNKIQLVPAVTESYLGWRQDSSRLGLVETKMLVTDISMVLNALDFRVLETHSHFKTRPCTAQNLSFKKEFCLREIKKIVFISMASHFASLRIKDLYKWLIIFNESQFASSTLLFCRLFVCFFRYRKTWMRALLDHRWQHQTEKFHGVTT